MSYPLIILGAGASYDSLDESQFPELADGMNGLAKFRPPVTSSIFNMSQFSTYIEKREYISELATSINAIVPHRRSFEDALRNLHEKASQNNEIYKWLVSLRFYLAEVFSEISEKYYKKVNNYREIINQININCGGSALVVNFNYDLLFEKNLSSIIDAKDPDNYIAGKLKIIKIHGACNWSYPASSILTPGNDFSIDDSTSYFFDNAAKIGLQPGNEQRYIINPPHWRYQFKHPPIHTDLYLPAIGLPIANKSHFFVCPKTHIDLLMEQLSQVDRVLVIGWKAGDQYLLDLMKQYLKKEIRAWIVNLKASEKEISERYSDIPNLKLTLFNGGFNAFVKDGKVEDFLSF